MRRAHALHPHELGAERRAGRSSVVRLRVWIDLTNSPHVLVMRPGHRGAAGARRRGAGHRARLRADARPARALPASTTRRSATTAAAGSRPRASGSSRARARSRAGRAGARFDVALGHGSNDITVAAKLLRIPSRDGVRLRVGARPAHGQLPARARASWCRTRSRPSGCAATARRRPSCAATRGSRRSTTWRTSSPTAAVLGELGSTPRAPLAVVRTPPAVSLYHRFEHPLFAQVLERLRGRAGRRAAAHARAARRAGARGRLRRARAGDRRAVAGRLRRPRRSPPAAR